MAPFAMGPANQPGNGSANPPMLNRTCSGTIYKGSILGYSSNLLVALATTPTAGTIVGVAASPSSSAPGYSMGNQPTVVTGRSNDIPFYPATTTTLYAAHLVNNSDTNIAPVLADVGTSYGIRVKADGEVAIDKNLTSTNSRVVVRDIDTDMNIVFFNFLASAIVQ